MSKRRFGLSRTWTYTTLPQKTKSPMLAPAAATMIGHHQTDALRRVPWCVQHRRTGVAEFDHLAVVKPGERQCNIRRFMQTVLGADSSCERRASGSMIGVHMGIDNVRDLHTLGSRKFKIRRDIVFVHIDHRALAETTAAK